MPGCTESCLLNRQGSKVHAVCVYCSPPHRRVGSVLIILSDAWILAGSCFSICGGYMTTERLVRIVAGFFVLFSLALGVSASPLFVNENWLWFTAFVGANLFQSGFSRFCPLEFFLKRLGVPSNCAGE
ncbi:DUF2892 domain-containing protein [Methylococcus sp. EFPC2]|uniref:YgaP family membrane protein n=1 Tax=Methylococcus sp. EFPC2 TaxID=2812648 RepID=UPI0035301A92